MRQEVDQGTNLDISFDIGAMPVIFTGEGRLLLVDQRLLPEKEELVDASDFDTMCRAIVDMVVRGAPSIGVAASFGLSLKARDLSEECDSVEVFIERLDRARKTIQETRPTAVNLMWETDRVFELAIRLSGDAGRTPAAIAGALVELSLSTLAEHIEINRRLSEYGKEIVRQGARVITHCNAGSLAACGWGTALGVIRSAHFDGRNPRVLVDETRPRNQGARLTMYELTRDGIPCTLICDSMAGHLMKSGEVDLVITGADRIARNGDSANKIGTYSLAVLASHHKIPFYIAAPLSTFDRNLARGDEIPIEHRSPSEVTSIDGHPNTVAGAEALNPAFDVTPADLIAGIICEAGILRPPYLDSIEAALDS